MAKNVIQGELTYLIRIGLSLDSGREREKQTIVDLDPLHLDSHLTKITDPAT